MVNLDRPGILGSGFGLYGYLPALIKSGSKKIYLPSRYKEKLSERQDLKLFDSSIEWVKDDLEVLDKSSSLIIALNPEMQAFWVPTALSKENINTLILEKPLAVSPKKSFDVLLLLIKSGKKFRINYIFRYLAWANKLNHLTKIPNLNLEIKWQFKAHHFKSSKLTWKSNHHLGGGVLRFYGIHFMALVAEWGYTDILYSETYGQTIEEPWKWKAAFSANNLSVCNIEINSKSIKNIFSANRINSNLIEENIAIGENPFITDQQSFNVGEDLRVTFINAGIFESFIIHNQEKENVLYTNILLLWEKIEKKNVFMEVN